MSNITKAIMAAKNQDPADMRDAIDNELGLRVAAALDDAKIAVAQDMFAAPEFEEDEVSADE
jgi:hypothetical protein